MATVGMQSENLDAEDAQFGISSGPAWSERSRSMKWLELAVLAALVIIASLTAFVLLNQQPESEPLRPYQAAALLIVNLLPAAAMLVLIGRRLALARARKADISSRQLIHVRLVAIFSLIAAIPTLFLVIFASFLFQTGVQFWFSDSARDMLVNAGELATGYYREKLDDVGAETTTMAGDLRFALGGLSADDPAFLDGYVKQVLGRKLSESAIVTIRADETQQTVAVVSPDDSPRKNWIDSDMLNQLNNGKGLVVSVKKDGIVAVTVLFEEPEKTYLFTKRTGDVPSFQLGEKAQSVLTDYRDMVSRSQQLQFQFNIALYVISLLIIAIVVWVALVVADRLIKPVNSLVDTAQKIADGDLSARVEEDTDRQDEVALLSRSFNAMTTRLETQTSTLLNANQQLDDRRAFIEAVLESVSAGVINIDRNRMITLANSTAGILLPEGETTIVGQPLSDVSARFVALLEDEQYRAVVQMGDGPDPQTLAVKISERETGHVITFEDISQQLADQRRAAWSDVARRIAHEIKNPLTPIQLAAERLQRRFGKQLKNDNDDSDVFGQLTETIVRQVSDLRNIADEFSSFARMPKPVFREESLTDIVAHSVFLFEVAHDDITFNFEKPKDAITVICDRRQIGQAITNLLKNAAEAVKDHMEQDSSVKNGEVSISLNRANDTVTIKFTDNGAGFPADRCRILEPYVTTRKSGSGLGLAIVQKIVAEHFGEIELEDSENGGALVRIVLRPAVLSEQIGIASKEKTSSDLDREK